MMEAYLHPRQTQSDAGFAFTRPRPGHQARSALAASFQRKPDPSGQDAAPVRHKAKVIDTPVKIEPAGGYPMTAVSKA